MRARVVAAGWLALFAVAYAPAGARLATRPPGVIKERTRLITVDVVALDSDGHVVHGLTQKDFQIFRGSRPKADHRPLRLR